MHIDKMIEPEIAFADLKDDMILAESMLKYIINYVLEHAPEEMQFFNNFVDKGLLERLKHVADSEFAHVTYTEAIEILEKNNAVRYITHRSNPSPKPACLAEPYLRRSR